MANLIGVRMAQPKTRNQIRKYAYQLRKDLDLLQTEKFPVMHVLEHVLPAIYPEFYLEPVEDRELQGRMAETVPDQRVIRVKESVYQAACIGDAWARMIMAHELGHFLFHDNQSTAYAYMEQGSHLPPDVDPERQADIFAAELLIPLHLIGDKNIYQPKLHQNYHIQDHWARSLPGVQRSSFGVWLTDWLNRALRLVLQITL